MGFHVTAVDPLYLKIPALSATLGSGQQDSLLVRLATDQPGLVGWGECDSSPLVGLAAYVCPPSHTCIHNICSVVVGALIETPADIVRLHEKVTTAHRLRLLACAQDNIYSSCQTVPVVCACCS